MTEERAISGFSEQVMEKASESLGSCIPLFPAEPLGLSWIRDEDLSDLHEDDLCISDSEDTIVQETRRNTSTNKSSHLSISSQSTTKGDESEAFEKAEILPNGNWKCRHKCGDKTKLESPHLISLNAANRV